MYGVNGHTLKTERKGVGGDRGGRPARERERERENLNSNSKTLIIIL